MLHKSDQSRSTPFCQLQVRATPRYTLREIACRSQHVCKRAQRLHHTGVQVQPRFSSSLQQTLQAGHSFIPGDTVTLRARVLARRKQRVKPLHV